MRAKTWKALIVAALAVVVLTAAVGGTMAWLSTNTNDLTNTFTPARVTCAVDETFNGQKKENVKIRNTGDTDAYIRAMVIGNWCDKDDKVVQSIDFDNMNYFGYLGANWFQGSDGFYYYKEQVAPEASTGALFGYIVPKENDKPDGADHLEVNIVCQAVQSTPAKAVTEAWPAVTVGADGKLEENGN